jgi:hypothetical protein
VSNVTILSKPTHCDFHALAGESVPATYDAWSRIDGGAYVCDKCYTSMGEPTLGLHATKIIVEVSV